MKCITDQGITTETSKLPVFVTCSGIHVEIFNVVDVEHRLPLLPVTP